MEPAILGNDSNISAGLCLVCVIQNGTSDGLYNHSFSYELWVRDNANHAIGGIGPLSLRPQHRKSNNYAGLDDSNTISVAVAGEQLKLISLINDYASGKPFVRMAWNMSGPTDWENPTLMQFPIYWDVDSDLRHHCFSEWGHDGILYFQCRFPCS